MLAPGTRLGPYEITAKLGEGGMGEVYRATDTKLRRDVAIKVLPAAFIADKERLARFEREAQLLAQLHHPNIASIFGLEESDGTKALVMELVEGPTLAERLEQGPFPLVECLSVALQIAQALEEAHEKGIIHRDLKPQNIKASLEGKVKVLDFGLAKAMEPVGAASGVGGAPQLAASPTLTLGATQMGVILGTAAYMAPEQAKGFAVDKRADIWAFGVVLHEMLSGRRLFEGDSVPDTLARVLQREIDFGALPESTPPAIRRLLRRCLERKPKNRLHDIADARIMIEEVLAGGPADEPAAASSAGARGKLGNGALVAVALAALAIGAVTGALLLRPRPAPPAPLRLELALPSPWKLATGNDQPALAISADGRRIAAVVSRGGGESRIAVRDLGDLEMRLLEGTEGARAAFFSPDGDWLAYFTRSELRKVALAGGRGIRIAEIDLSTARDGVWGSDGFIYFVPGFAVGVSRVPEAGGVIEPVTKLDLSRGERTHRFPALTPDGRALLYTSDTAASPAYYDDARIEAVELGSGTRHVLVEGSSQARMLGDDLLVYANTGNLFAVRVDPRRLAVTSQPVALEQSVRTIVDAGNVDFAIAATGAAVWSTGTQYQMARRPRWVGRDGTRGAEAIPPDPPVRGLALTPDGKRLALVVSNAATLDSSLDIWIADLERGSRMRLSFDESAAVPIWSPDGRRVAYRRPVDRAKPLEDQEVVWRAADGSGDAELLFRSGGQSVPGCFSPDGRELVAVVFNNRSLGSDLWLVPVGAPDQARPLVASPDNENDCAISPDGRWLAYSALGVGNPLVFVQPFPDGGGKWQVGAGAEPRWSADGRELFFTDSSGLYRAAVESGPHFASGTPERLFDADTEAGNPRTYGVDSAHGRFLILLGEGASAEDEAALHVVNYATDWLARARALSAPR